MNIFNGQVVELNGGVKERREQVVGSLGRLLSDQEVIEKRLMHCPSVYQAMRRLASLKELNAERDLKDNKVVCVLKPPNLHDVDFVANDQALSRYFSSFYLACPVLAVASPACNLSLGTDDPFSSLALYPPNKYLHKIFSDVQFEKTQKSIHFSNLSKQSHTSNRFSNRLSTNHLQLDGWPATHPTSQSKEPVIESLSNATIDTEKSENSLILTTTLVIGGGFLLLNIAVFGATFAQWYLVKKKLKKRDTSILKPMKGTNIKWENEEMAVVGSDNKALVFTSACVNCAGSMYSKDANLRSSLKKFCKNAKLKNSSFENCQVFQCENLKRSFYKQNDYSYDDNDDNTVKTTFRQPNDHTINNFEASSSHGISGEKKISFSQKGSNREVLMCEEGKIKSASHYDHNSMANAMSIKAANDNIDCNDEAIDYDQVETSGEDVNEVAKTAHNYEHAPGVIGTSKTVVLLNPSAGDGRVLCDKGTDINVNQVNENGLSAINNKVDGTNKTSSRGSNTTCSSSMSLHDNAIGTAFNNTSNQLPLLKTCLLLHTSSTQPHHVSSNLSYVPTTSSPSTHHLQPSSQALTESVKSIVRFEDSFPLTQNELAWKVARPGTREEKSLSQETNACIKPTEPTAKSQANISTVV